MSSTEDNANAAEVLAAVPDFAELVAQCPPAYNDLVGKAIRPHYAPGQVVFLRHSYRSGSKLKTET